MRRRRHTLPGVAKGLISIASSANSKCSKRYVGIHEDEIILFMGVYEKSMNESEQ